MPFTNYANLDFNQIKTQIKDYLRANSTFTDFDFEGSNFSVLIDTLAYNTYITAFNSNLAVNESFIESATLRENVVSLARNIGYVPRSRRSARAKISFSVKFYGSSSTVTLKAGLVCVGREANSAYIFSIPEDITTVSPLDNPGIGLLVGDRTATFENISIYQGSFVKKSFIVDQSLDQRFILPNAFIDTETLITKIKSPNDPTAGIEYTLIDNILNIDKNSEVYFLQEVKDEKYELLFGDGILGKKLETNSEIDATYIVTDGPESNGVSLFSFSGILKDSLNADITPTATITVSTAEKASGGTEIEDLQSIKYFAPKLYSSQYRAVTASDYEALVKTIYPAADSVSVTGGEELNPPKFGEVIISIKPKNDFFVSDFNKEFITNRLKRYSLAGIKQTIVDLEILYLELDSYVYYNSSKVNDIEALKTQVSDNIKAFGDSSELNNFGGRFKYSKLLQKIDNTSTAITSNITRVTARRDLKISLNKSAQYEICYGNEIHVENDRNIKSTGFKIFGNPDTLYLTDTPNADKKKGIISFIKLDSNNKAITVVKEAGSVDYIKGEVILYTTKIISTDVVGGLVEVQMYPESNDVIGLKNIYIALASDRSTINMLKDTISSGEEISGVGFPVTSSYSNGSYIRIQ
jgi:hypothetical protein